MKGIFIFLYMPVLCLSQVWVRLDDFPGTKRDDGVGVVVDGQAYFGTGLQEWNATIDFRVLNLSALSWSAIPNMPHTTERQYACAFKGAGCFYVFGGAGKTDALNTLFKYDITTQTWTEKTSKPGKGLVAAAVFEFGGKVIVSNGKYGDNAPNYEVWEYDLNTDVWVAKTPFPLAPRWRSAYATLNGNGYLIGGLDSVQRMRRELIKYNPQSDTWSVIDSFPGPGRAYAAMQGFDKRLFVFGGIDSSQNYHNDFWSLDPDAGSWHVLPSPPGDGRRGGMSCADGNNFYYSCGIGPNGRLTETWRTDLPTNLQEHDRSVLSLYPNPFNGSLWFAEAADPVQRATLYCVAGLLVLDAVVENNKLDVPVIPAGIYLLKVETKNGRVLTRKIIRE